MNLEELTFKQICKCLGMMKKLVEENIIDFDIDNSFATLKYDKALEYLEKQNVEQKQEIERLKQGYCELKEKCNRGECDCTHEEYDGMCEANMKMYLEIERLNAKEEQLIRKLDDLIIVGEQVENEWAKDICKMVIEELKGEDKE